jgi:hypothetical protein
MKNLLPSTRYIWRELIPRVILMTVAFKWLMPLIPLFQFHGDLVSATAFGVAFTAWFSLWGAYIMGSQSVQSWFSQRRSRWWMPAVHVTMMLLVPIIGLATAAVAAPTVFAMQWLYGSLAGAVVLNAVCAATHDYKSGTSSD